MTRAFDAKAAARYVLDSHQSGAPYSNLPPEIAPQSIAEGYAAQEALAELLTAQAGPVAGLKIATTTKVMQALMGIDHPCGGMVFERRVHRSPASLQLSDFQNLMVECELAVRVGRDLPATGAPYTGDSLRDAVTELMPAFELIEDRHADYKQSQVLSLLADNCWNAGVVLGTPVRFDGARKLAGLEGVLTINGEVAHRGLTDEALETLAWIANLAAERGRPVRAGMFVITGSVIATVPIRSGDRFSFRIADLGSVELSAR